MILILVIFTISEIFIPFIEQRNNLLETIYVSYFDCNFFIFYMDWPNFRKVLLFSTVLNFKI